MGPSLRVQHVHRTRVLQLSARAWMRPATGSECASTDVFVAWIWCHLAIQRVFPLQEQQEAAQHAVAYEQQQQQQQAAQQASTFVAQVEDGQWPRASGASGAYASSTDTPGLHDGGSVEPPQSAGGGASPRSTSGRRSDVVARVQRHFSRPTNDESADMTLESARSSELGSRMGSTAEQAAARSRKRFTYFNTLFKSRKHGVSAGGM